MLFYLGSESGSGIKTNKQEEFIQYIIESIKEADQAGNEVFELEIIQN